MITTEDIQKVEFDKVMRGYRTDDVHAYLEQLAAQMETMRAEREDVEKKLYILAQKVEEYRKEEDMLKTAMLNAQRMGENVIREAKQKADSIVREADLKANLIETRAKDKVIEQEQEFTLLQAKIAQFKNEVLGIYKLHIQSLSELPVDKDAEADENESDDALDDDTAVYMPNSENTAKTVAEEMSDAQPVAPIMEAPQSNSNAFAPIETPDHSQALPEDAFAAYAPQPIAYDTQPAQETTQEFAPIEKPSSHYQPVFGTKPFETRDVEEETVMFDINAPQEPKRPAPAMQNPFAVLGMEPKNFAIDDEAEPTPQAPTSLDSVPGSIFDQYKGINFHD